MLNASVNSFSHSFGSWIITAHENRASGASRQDHLYVHMEREDRWNQPESFSVGIETLAFAVGKRYLSIRFTSLVVGLSVGGAAGIVVCIESPEF